MLLSCSSRTKVCFRGEKSDHGFGLCMQMSVWNIMCAGGLIFFHFPCFWGIVKSGQIFSPITQMRLLFLAQWGLTLIREGTKCCFSSCLAVWGLKEVKEGWGKTGSSGDFRCLSRYRGPTTVSYLFDVFFLSKKMISFLLIFFSLWRCKVPFPVKSLFFLSSSSLCLISYSC